MNLYSNMTKLFLSACLVLGLTTAGRAQTANASGRNSFGGEISFTSFDELKTASLGVRYGHFFTQRLRGNVLARYYFGSADFLGW